MEKNKSDESVKAGLNPGEDTNPLTKEPIINGGYDDIEKEQDADAVIHEAEHTPVTANTDEEHDMDDLVHTVPPTKTVMDNNEKDPDDLVHQK